MIRWGHPTVLYLLPLILALGIFLFYARAAAAKRFRERFASDDLLPRIAPRLSVARRRLKDFLLMSAAVLVTIAWADPQVGTRLEEVKREGIDLVVALDVSHSMLAKDVAPSRLEKAKHEVRTLLDKLQGDRVALAAFSGKAVIVCPLTLDYGAAEIFLDVMDPDVISYPGTSIGAAIKTALQAFGEESHAGKAILLITDGEDHEEQISSALKEAKEKGVVIHAVGIGSPQGVPIPTGAQGGDFKRDRDGNVVVTRLDETTLQEIAAETGGVYQRWSSSEGELDQIIAAISGLEKGELGMKRFTQYEHRFQPFLLAALLLLAVEFLLSDQKMRLVGLLRIFAAGDPQTNAGKQP